MGARDLVQLIRGSPEDKPQFALGTIPGSYASGRPQIIFDGETVATTRTWPKAKGLTLTAGDRVLVALMAHGGVVICVIE